MDNFYLERITARMEQDGALHQLNRHWSARLCRWVNYGGYFLDKVGLLRLSGTYTTVTTPLTNWLGEKQSAFILRRWF